MGSKRGQNITLTTDSEKEIQAYINNFPQCKLNRIQPTEIGGKRVDLDVFSLPTRLLYFNIRNGRFAAEYKEKKSKIGRDLEPKDKKDALIIRHMLLEQSKEATKLLKEDLCRVGQKNPGIVTSDGAVINGNRRLAVFQHLYEETGEEKWAYFEVSILPRGTSEKDIWRIEAGLQFSREERLDYGPINRLLKLREGVNAGLTPQQIAATLYGGFKPKEIQEDLDRLKLIESYLDFVGKPGHYKTAEGLHEHFIDLRKMIVIEQEKGTDPLDLWTITKYGFEMIRNGISHWDVRNLKDILNDSKARANLIGELKENKEIAYITQTKVVVSKPPFAAQKSLVEKNPDTISPISPLVPETLPPPAKDGPAIQIFLDSREIAEASEESNKPVSLLKKALTNLKGINLSSLKANSSANGSNVKTLIEELDQELAKIRQALQK